ncbi:hypothetical protein DPMN_063576 [Dreissena polymorpha]|uniref:Uncharacterized protein n=1 Tax=Dreissena polymorpha TaxID=45954 RepID=A0A9D4CAS0_DREPO|nr:hypothetical protein DPMN_063576 [Dreissena polymorpha]
MHTVSHLPSLLIALCLLARRCDTGLTKMKKLVHYIGQVISQVPGYSDWYNIKYSGDPAIYTYQLLKDYSQGDLELLVQ